MANAEKYLKEGVSVEEVKTSFCRYLSINGYDTSTVGNVCFALEHFFEQSIKPILSVEKELTYEQLRKMIDETSKYFVDVLNYDKKEVEETKAKFIKSYLKPTLTEDEKVILRNMKICNENLETIEKDKDGDLYITSFHFSKYISMYNHLFQFIKERKRI